MKGILRNIVSVLLLLCLAFSIVACGEETGNNSSSNTGSVTPKPEIPLRGGEIYRVQEVYEAGEIDRTALLNIAYYTGSMDCNSPEVQEEKFELFPKGELSEEISLSIKGLVAEQYRNRQNNPKPEAKAEDFIIYYYGCYNGYYVFRHNDPYYESTSGGIMGVINGIWIDGIFLMEEYPQYIYAWKEI